jgi:HPt (histidine-containing phosphotransfer) domain-containing protein
VVSSEPQSNAVDADTIAALREDGSLLRELRDLFQIEAADQLDQMAAARSHSDPRMLATAAHRLKGSAVTFGAEQLRRLCLELEQTAQTGPLGPEVEDLLAHVRAECERVKLALDAAL